MANTQYNSLPQDVDLTFGREMGSQNNMNNWSPTYLSLPQQSIDTNMGSSANNTSDVMSLINTCLAENDIPDLSKFDAFDLVSEGITKNSLDSSENRPTLDMANHETNVVSNLPTSPPIYSDTFIDENDFVVNTSSEFANDQINSTISTTNKEKIHVREFEDSFLTNEINVIGNNIPVYSVPEQYDTMDQSMVGCIQPANTPMNLPILMADENFQAINFQRIAYGVQDFGANDCISNIQECTLQPAATNIGNSSFVPRGQMNIDMETTFFNKDAMNCVDDNSMLAQQTGNILNSAIISTVSDGTEVQTKDEHECMIERMIDSFLNPEEDVNISPPNPPMQNMRNKPMDSSVQNIDVKKILESFKSSVGEESAVVINAKVAVPKYISPKSRSESFVIPNKKICIEVKYNNKPGTKAAKKEPKAIPSTSYKSNTANSAICETSNINIEPVASTSYATPTVNFAAIQPPLRSSLEGGKYKRTIKTPSKYKDTIASDNFDDSEIPNENCSGKRKRQCLENLTPAEKYHRIRAQNNIASKKCRLNKKKKGEKVLQELELETACNTRVKLEYAAIQKRLARWRALYFFMINNAQ